MKIDDITLSLKIEGVLWEGQGKTVEEIHIIEKYEYAVPILMIRISDYGNNIGSTVMLNDGCLLELTWGQGKNIYTHKFRLAKFKMNMDKNTYYYDITAWMDYVKWFTDGNNKAYKGTSGEVIKKIAEECGLAAECDTTRDSQTWLGGSDINYVFARKIARKGYASDDSLMGLAVCTGAVRYRDMNTLADKDPLLGFIHGLGTPTKSSILGKTMNCFPLTTFRVHIKSGVYNLIQGYKAAQEDPNIADPTKEGIFLNLPIKPKTNSLSMSNNITNQVTTPKIRTGPIKSNNTHEKYNGADYTNRRGSKILRNAKIEFTTSYFTGVTLFDQISLKLSNTNAGATGKDGNNNIMFDGPYIIYCKTVYIRGNVYAEKIVCEREGLLA